MKNIALCFDNAGGGTGNPAALHELLSSDDSQLLWSRTGAADVCGARTGLRVRRSREFDAARTSVTDAYEFLVDRWEPGDRLFVFGAGRGASCARALARLLGTVGVLRGTESAGWTVPDFREYVLSTYAMPRTPRSAADWKRVARLAAQLSGSQDATVAVDYLGLWDTLAVPGCSATDALPNVPAARHALAIDGRTRPIPLGWTAAGVQEVWFRGAHCDVTGGRHACAPLSDITLDWVLDGAVKAGVTLGNSAQTQVPAPSAVDALAGSAHPMSLRRVPADAAVHASVECYVRAHPSYWRRLPARVEWADPEWVARGERLVASPATGTLAAPPTLVSAS